MNETKLAFHLYNFFAHRLRSKRESSAKRDISCTEKHLSSPIGSCAERCAQRDDWWKKEMSEAYLSMISPITTLWCFLSLSLSPSLGIFVPFHREKNARWDITQALSFFFQSHITRFTLLFSTDALPMLCLSLPCIDQQTGHSTRVNS